MVILVLSAQESTIAELKTLIEDMKKSHKCYRQVRVNVAAQYVDVIHGTLESFNDVELAISI